MHVAAIPPRRYYWRYHRCMVSMPRLVEQMRRSPRSVRYADLEKVCISYFGPARRHGGSHAVFRTPWQGDPRVNIQNDHGMAKSYQVKQVLEAIDRLEGSAEQ